MQLFKRFIKLQHLLMQRSGGYTFIRTNVLKFLGSITVLLVFFYLFDEYVVDFDSAADWATKFFSPAGLISIFFFSELTLGLLPPELLIVWAGETLKPTWMLVLLATLSYAAGLGAYFIGKFWRTRAFVKNYLLRRYEGTFSQLNRFGGLLLILAALTPLPFPIICQLSGLNGYPFKKFALFILVRFVRFAVYGALLYKLF